MTNDTVRTYLRRRGRLGGEPWGPSDPPPRSVSTSASASAGEICENRTAGVGPSSVTQPLVSSLYSIRNLESTTARLQPLGVDTQNVWVQNVSATPQTGLPRAGVGLTLNTRYYPYTRLNQGASYPETEYSIVKGQYIADAESQIRTAPSHSELTLVTNDLSTG